MKPDTNASYKHKVDAAIRDLIMEYECQPILFIGSGLSRRYFGAPSWRDLLKKVFENLSIKGESFEYYCQKNDNNMILVGTDIANVIFEWAWKEGKTQFPDEFFSESTEKDTFLKYLVCEYLKNITISPDNVNESLRGEVSAMSNIKPHAIITTNYDLFLENVFDGYEPITGQTILRYNTNSFGEIFHIHGDISRPDSIVLTQRDFDEWSDRKKYISAKLLTYFAEHPVFIMGYGLGDPNIKEILRDISELVPSKDGLIENIYQVVWKNEMTEANPPEQAVFQVEGKEYRTMAIHTSNLEWVFEALRSQSALTSINPKLVRALAARTMKLVRHDIPTGSVDVDYDLLERVAVDNDELPKLLGITSAENPNHSHPYTLTQVAKRLGFNHWQPVHKIILRIVDEKGVDLRSTDNKYHCRIKIGNKKTSAARKWSHEAVDLFRRVEKDEPYELNI